MTAQALQIPKLKYSLWAAHSAMLQAPFQMLRKIRKMGFEEVEIAGFFHYPIDKYLAEITNADLTVSAVHLPPIKPDRNIAYYNEWLEQYSAFSGTKHFVLETNPRFFQGERKTPSPEDLKQIVGLVGDISILHASNYTFSYHAFPHDFSAVNNTSICDQLNLLVGRGSFKGLQLDTYWLNTAHVQPSRISDLSIASIHLNDRNSKGMSQVLGDAESICSQYMRAIRKDAIFGVEWILENDSQPNIDQNSDAAVMLQDHDNSIAEFCLKQWGIIFSTITQGIQQ